MQPLIPLPPPDAAVPVRRSAARSLAVGMFAGGLVGAGIAGLFLGSTFSALGPVADAAPRAPVTLALGIAGTLLAIFVHELGHVLAGLTQDFRFAFLIVGPMRIERDESDQRLRLAFNRNIELAGGIAGCVPTTPDDLVRRMQWFVAGGPLASLGLAAVCLALALLAPVSWWSANVALAGLASFALGALTLVPVPNGSFVNDGLRLLQLRRGGPEALRLVAQLTMLVQDRIGVSMSSMTPELLQQMLEPVDGSMHELSARATAWAWLLGTGRPDEARAHLERAAALATGLPFHLDAIIDHERAFHAAFVDGDAVSARALLAPHAGSRAPIPEEVRARVSAAIAAAEGRVDDALAQLAHARAHIAAAAGGTTGSMQWTLERLDELEQRLMGNGAD
jgi:hypothetical protein